MTDDISKILELVEVVSKDIETISNNSSQSNGRNKFIEIRGVLVEMKKKLISLNTEIVKRTKIHTDLEKKVFEYEDWEKKKTNYEPYNLTSSVIVYRKKIESQGIEYPEYYCPNCINEHKESLISIQDQRNRIYKCVKCKWKVQGEPPLSSFTYG